MENYNIKDLLKQYNDLVKEKQELQACIDKIFAEERIKKACELALLTDKEQEEVSKDLDKKIDEKLDKLANAILKELFEGGSNDGQ